MFCITEKDILKVYKEEGKLKEYNNCLKYLSLMSCQTDKSLKQLAKALNINVTTARHWIKKERTPCGIKTLNFLKENRLLPYYPNEITARIVGFLFGDGFLYESLRGFGFSSTDIETLRKIRKDIKREFGISCKIKKVREIGDKELIYGKTVYAKYPGYSLKYNNASLSRLLYKLVGFKGKKTGKIFLLPNWIVKGSKDIQKSFLQSLFDSDLSNFQVYNYKRWKNRIYPLRLNPCKEARLEDNLREYLKQIKIMLENFDIKSDLKLRNEHIKENGKKMISLTLFIHSSLRNIYNFINNLNFNYSSYKYNKSLYVKKLIIEKIKHKNYIYNILSYCVNKEFITTKDLEDNLPISKSYSKIIGKYIIDKGFASRIRTKGRWYKYYPKKEKISKIINNEKELFKIPPIKNATRR